MASPPPLAKRRARAPAPAAECDDILRKIFLLLDSSADLARACAASPAFRRVITDPHFLRCFRALHPPPLLGVLNDVFLPAEPPHPSAPVARWIAHSDTIDFSCKSFLPSPDRWQFCDSREGRVLCFGDRRPRHEKSCCYNHCALGRPLAVCDPLHRRYVMLPAIPENLAALVEHGEYLHHFTTFLALPAEDEQEESLLAAHPTEEEKGLTAPSFRVTCMVQSASKLVLFVFSSGVGVQQWRAVNFDDWSSLGGLSDDTGNYHPIQTLFGRSYVHGCFYWLVYPKRKKLVVLDARESTPRFFTMDIPPHARWTSEEAFVEAGGEEERIAVVTVCRHEYKDMYQLHYYAVLRGDDGDRWELEAKIDLPLKFRIYKFIGVAGRYLLLEGTPEGWKSMSSGPDIGCFSLDLQFIGVLKSTFPCTSLAKYSGKLKGWKPRFLYTGGRLTLTRSVLMALPLHLLAVLPIPQWALDVINRRCRGFVWKGEEEINGGHCLLPWSRVCAPLQVGGLGILNLRLFGTALRCRWPWLKWAPEQRPWSLIPATEDKDALALFRAGAFIKIGDGQKAKFWSDNWLPGGKTVRDVVPILFTFVRDSGITVASAITNHRWARDIQGGISTQALAEYLKLWDMIAEVQLTPGQADAAVWRRTKDGGFSVNSAYQLFFMASTSFACAKPIWKSKAPMKCKFFMWLAVHRRCLTADNLARRGWPHNTICQLCLSMNEDCTHLFVHCHFTQQVWLPRWCY